MKPPLALLEVKRRNTYVWRTFQTADSAKGCNARRVVYVRTPSDWERDTVDLCLEHPEGIRAWDLEKLLS